MTSSLTESLLPGLCTRGRTDARAQLVEGVLGVHKASVEDDAAARRRSGQKHGGHVASASNRGTGGRRVMRDRPLVRVIRHV